MGRACKVPYTKGMSPAMAALRAFVCTLVTFGVMPAFAERRPVAVVNLDLADESKARELAEGVIDELRDHPDLKSLGNPTDEAALKDRIVDPDKAGLDAALDFKSRAEAELVQFNTNNARLYAEEGRKALLTVQPLAAVQLYADLAFLEGLAYLADERAADADAAFAQCARLDPTRMLDPARFRPQVVTAYAKARGTVTAPGFITIEGNGRAWIDGIEVGQAPGGFSAAAGRHVVWLTGAERSTGGASTVVTAAQQAKVAITNDTGSIEGHRLAVQRARIALARAADATAKAGAMTALAKLVGVEDAVLLQVSADKVIVQTWRAGNVERAPGFSALRERNPKEKAIELLTPLAPPKQRVDPDDGPIVKPKPIVVAKRWYQRRSVQAGIVVGVIGAIVGGYLISTGGVDSLFWNSDTQVDRPMTGRR